MKYAAEEFKIFPADIDETIPENTDPVLAAEYTAVRKAEAVHEKFPDDIIVGCDTVVLLDGEIMGKPSDRDNAFEMLSRLSGRTHKVITGVCIRKGNRIKSFSQCTEVDFYPLSKDDILSYIETGDPMDKAGAYGIQSEGCVLVKGIRGDFFNVVGLPAARLKRELSEFIKEDL